MMLGQHKITLRQNIVTWVGSLGRSSRTAAKTHDYTHHQPDLDYVIEPIEHPNQYHMTGQGKGVKLGDRIMLQHQGQTQTYTVKKIDYYTDPSGMWIALLEENYS
ncbi:hypothetical protein ACQ4M4_04935 [Leptolyngbya sp. AN02str]|uniref:hypothetical protein n=1 Tax=Leptolyngbya sp. AN02str TaxID=3423363 RepID=UPI003D31091B